MPRGEAPWKFLSFTPRWPLEALIFTSVIDLLLPACTSFKTHGKAQFLFVAFSLKHGSVSYHLFLNIKRFDMALNYFHFRTKKNGGPNNLIVATAVSGNQAYSRLAVQTKQTLGKNDNKKQKQ